MVHIPHSVSGGKLWGWGRVAGGQCTGKDLWSCLLVPPSAAVSWVDDRLLGPQIPLCLLRAHRDQRTAGFQSPGTHPANGFRQLTLVVLYSLTEIASSFFLVMRLEIFMYRHLFNMFYTHIYMLYWQQSR